MPIDPRIALGVQPLQLPQQDPNQGMNALARMMQLRGMQDEQQVNALRMQDMQRTSERRNKLDSLLGGFNGKPEELGSTLLKGGFIDEAGKIEKDRRENLKVDAETAYKKVETAHKTAELAGQTMGWLRQNPTLENANAAITHLVTVGGMPREQGQQILASLQANPAGIANFADMVFRSALATKEQLPKLQTNNIGGSTVTQQFDPVSGQQLGVASTIKNTQSPDSVATTGLGYAKLNEDKRHNTTMEGYRNTEIGQGKAPAGYRATADGKGLEYIPGGPADPNSARRAAPTEDERKAAGWVAQARFAYDNMEKAIKADPSAAKPGIMESIPGMPENTANMTRSAGRQQFNQAASSFAEAALRAATGAGVNKEEAQQKIRELTPQWGDKQPVIDQKKAALNVYLNALETRAGNALRSVQQPPAGGAVDPGNDPLGIRR